LLNSLTDWIGVLAQASASAPTAPSTKPSTPPGVLDTFLNNPLILPMLALATLYLMVLRPQQKADQKAKLELQQLRSNLKKDDRIVTLGGIYGSVVSTNSDAGTVTIRIDESTNAKMTISRDAIAKVVVDGVPSAKS
jgi:preprotein translocase subunit YajC